MRIAGDFRADVRFDFCFFRGQVKARGAVDAVGIEQGHGGHVELSADCGQFLGQGRAFEKTESRAGVEFDVHQLPVISDQWPVARIKNYWISRSD